MSATQKELDALAKEIQNVRVLARAVEIATFGRMMGNGYSWAVYEAWAEERAREQNEAEQFVAKADLSSEAVLNAVAVALDDSAHGAVKAGDVAIVLLPEAVSPRVVGRQLLIARVGATMRELVAAGALVRVSEPAGRKTGRYALAREAVAS